MARKRNLDAAPRPGPRYQGETEIVHGSDFDPEQTPEGRRLKLYQKAKQSVADTRRNLAWRSQHGPEG